MTAKEVSSADSRFEGSIPALYDRYLVPLIFEPYARDMARIVADFEPGAVLELAAGTGVVTRELARNLAPHVSIVATDLNQAMLDQAAKVGTARPVEWRQADAMQLPFADQTFDVVACQFGVMFFPDKVQAFAEARRVLKQGGHFVFNAWDRVEHNEMISVVCGAIDELHPEDPPRFMHRGPHGYADKAVITRDLASAGFARSEVTVVAHRSPAPSSLAPVMGYLHGSPLRMEIEAKGTHALAQATAAAIAALEKHFGPGPIEGRIQAHVVVAQG